MFDEDRLEQVASVQLFIALLLGLVLQHKEALKKASGGVLEDATN